MSKKNENQIYAGTSLNYHTVNNSMSSMPASPLKKSPCAWTVS